MISRAEPAGSWRMAAGAFVAIFGATLGLGACGTRPPSLDELLEDDDCRRTVLLGDAAAAVEALEADSVRREAAAARAVEWRLPPESLEVAQLNAWCAAVGPAVVADWGDTSSVTPVMDTLWLVSWNVHVGGGDLLRLVEDLRAGRLTDGVRPRHFVLLVQEAHRDGERLPPLESNEPGGSPVTAAPPSGPREDIVAAAERFGLRIVYVPSMRNGETEDRGNAILSTLALEEPTALELPVARQRRVAVAAGVSGRTRSGRDWRLQVASVHLESSPSGWRSDEEQRLEQAEELVALLPEAEAAVAGGDFNTQTRGVDEALVHTMLRAYPDTPPFPTGPTYRKAFGLYRHYLDYIFFRLPDDTDAAYDRVPGSYASDHYPLVGRVVW